MFTSVPRPGANAMNKVNLTSSTWAKSREVWIPKKNQGVITKRRGIDDGKVKIRCLP